jgi:hypothetical protein
MPLEYLQSPRDLRQALHGSLLTESHLTFGADMCHRIASAVAWVRLVADPFELTKGRDPQSRYSSQAGTDWF